MKRNRKLRYLLSGVAAAALVGGGIGYHLIAAAAEKEETQYQETAVQYGNLSLTFEEEGTTQIGAVEQLPGFSVDAVCMTVEEVYVGTGDTVNEGDALLKVTDESMAEAKEYYEEAVAKAEKNLETAELSCQTGTLEAEHDYQEKVQNADSAAAGYEADLSSLKIRAEEKQETYDSAVEEISKYQNALDSGNYYTEVGINEKQADADQKEIAFAEAKSTSEQAQTAYGTSETAVGTDLENLNSLIENNASGEALLAATAQLAADCEAQRTAAANLSAAQAAAAEAQSALDKAKQTFESAVKEYDLKVEKANEKITELTESLEGLLKDVEQANRDAVTQEAGIEKDYDEAVLEGQYAASQYQSALMTLQANVDAAKEKRDTLQKEQEAVLAMKDGIFRADRTGTIASVNNQTEDVLNADTALVTYYDTDTILISVEVAQEQIAQIAVGDEAEIAVSGERNGTLAGTISSIASSKTTGTSSSNVTYTVIAAIDNSEGELSSGTAAAVTFSYGEMEDVLYIESEAVTEGTGSKGTVQQFDKNGTVTEVPVTVGEHTGTYTVITEGLKEGDICLIEAGGTK